MISYAQFQTDLAVAQLFDPGYVGTYLDIGAHHPITISNTYYFYKLGWRGITVDPDPRSIELHKQLRPSDFQILAAISNKNGLSTFFQCEETSLSTLDPEEAVKRKAEGFVLTERPVSLKTVESLIAECNNAVAPDILSIDVEGHEREVLQGCPFSPRWKPKVIVIEATLPCTKVPCHARWEEILLDAGYAFHSVVGINRIYHFEDN